MSTTPPTNIFQTISEGIKPITKDLAEQESYNRQQRESLIATKMVNEFQSKMSQSLLDQEVNWKGENDPHAYNTEMFKSGRDEILSGVKNERIRNLVDRSLSTYQTTFETSSKIQSLNLEGQLQTGLMNENLSYKKAAIATNPGMYDEIMGELNTEAQTWRPDLKQKYYNANVSELNSSYIDSQYEAYKKDYLSDGGEIQSTDQFRIKIEELKKRANIQGFYLTPEKRDAANGFLDDKLNTQLAALQKTRESLADAALKASFETIKNGVPLPLPEGMSEVEYTNALIAKVAPDDPAKRKELELEFQSSKIQGLTKQAIEESGFQAAENSNRGLDAIASKAYDEGDMQTFNKYKETIANNQIAIDKTKEEFKKNTANYWLNLSGGQKSSQMKMEFRMFHARPFGQRDPSGYISDIYQNSYTMEPDKSNIKFLPPEEIANYHSELEAISSSGNVDQFMSWAAGLRHDWGDKDQLAGGIDIYESVLQQLNTTNEKGEVTSPAVGLALKHVLIDPQNARNIFTLLTRRENGKPTGILTAVTLSEKSANKESMKKAVDMAFKEYEQAFNIYPDFLEGANPSINSKGLIMEMAMNSNAKPDLFRNAKSVKDIAKILVDMTVAREFKVVKSGAAGGTVAIPIKQNSQAIEAFTQSRKMQTMYLRDLKDATTTVPFAKKLGVGGVQARSNKRFADFSYSNGDGMTSPGTIPLSELSVIESGKGIFSPIPTQVINQNGNSILIPLVVDGKELIPQEAVDYYKKSGRNLGIFNNKDNADKFEQALNRHLGDVYTGKKIDPLQSGFSTPVTQQGNLFDQDELGFLKSIRYQSNSGKMEKLKVEQLLTNGFFLPINGGRQYRLHVHSLSEGADFPLIINQDQDGKPLYYEIDKTFIENDLYPKYKNKAPSKQDTDVYFM